MGNTKKESYKRYLALSKRENEINVAQKNLGYVELETPIHHGYLSYFVLREDVANRENGDELASLLAKYSHEAWCRTKDFIVKRKKQVEIITPKLMILDERDYLKLPVKTQAHFRMTWVEYWGGMRKGFILDFPRHYLVIKRKKDYITHRKVIDGALEAEEAFIRDKIWEIFYKSSPYDNGRMKPYAKARNKSERRTNKIMLKSNFNTYNGVDEDDLENGLLYKHRNSAKWDRW